MTHLPQHPGKITDRKLLPTRAPNFYSLSPLLILHKTVFTGHDLFKDSREAHRTECGESVIVCEVFD